MNKKKKQSGLYVVSMMVTFFCSLFEEIKDESEYANMIYHIPDATKKAIESNDKNEFKYLFSKDDYFDMNTIRDIDIYNQCMNEFYTHLLKDDLTENAVSLCIVGGRMPRNMKDVEIKSIYEIYYEQTVPYCVKKSLDKIISNT